MLKHILLISVLFFSSYAFAEQKDLAAYTLVIESLKNFSPGSAIKMIQEEYGKGREYFRDGDDSIYRFILPGKKFNVTLFVRFKGDVATALWASLPTHLQHHLFHQALIAKHGKQDRYFKKENSGVYIWERDKNTRLIYSGQCTLFCFPLYLAIFSKEQELERAFFIKGRGGSI